MKVNLGCGARLREGWINMDFSSVHPSVRAHDLKKGIPLEDSSVDLVYHSHLLEHFTREGGGFFLSECQRVLKPGGVVRVAVPDLEAVTRAYLTSLDEARAGAKGADRRHEWMTIELIDQMVRDAPGGEMLKYLSSPEVLEKDFVLKRVGTEGRRIIEDADRMRREAGKKGSGEGFGGAKTLAGAVLRPLREALFRRSGEVHRWMYDAFSLRKALEASGFVDVVQRTAFESFIPGWKDELLDTEPDGSVYKPDSLYMEGLKTGAPVAVAGARG